MKRLPALCAAALLASCASTPDDRVGPPAKEMLLAVTADHKLIRFNGGQPQRIQSSQALKGLKPGEQVLGIDFRVARNQLYLLASSGQLYRVKVADATLEAIGAAVPLPAGGGEWGFDFNPTVDRIRVVHETGANLRRHPDSGIQIDGNPGLDGLQGDGTLQFDAGDANANRTLRVGAAAYTYNKQDEKLTTNYAIELSHGLLVTQGTKEGVAPAVSPNSGRLFTVGRLGLPAFSRVHFDISDVSNAAYVAIDEAGGDAIYRVDLTSGKASRVARVGTGVQLRGIAIEP